ncbi:MAG: hypothetical protein PHX14_13045 [Syntrophomonadaceae bacterium]|nr:hypothetical protein [Syntrophomonadaceae bacterium]
MEIKRLSGLDLPRIMELQNMVLKVLGDHSLYYALAQAEVEAMLGEQGLSLGIYAEEQHLIAYAAVRFPGSEPDNLGIDSKLNHEELTRVAHIEAGLVHPDFRGQNLQKLIYEEAILQTRMLGRFRHLYSTVACHNYPALINSLKLGLVITALETKYGGYLRYVLYQDWAQPLSIDRSQVFKVACGDRERQEALLAEGWLGFAWEKNENQMLLHYGRRFKA